MCVAEALPAVLDVKEFFTREVDSKKSRNYLTEEFGWDNADDNVFCFFCVCFFLPLKAVEGEFFFVSILFKILL